MQRFLSQLVVDQVPDVPLRLTFKPAEATQVDFGAGPTTFQLLYYALLVIGSCTKSRTRL